MEEGSLTGWVFCVRQEGGKVRIRLGYHKVSGEQMQVYDLSSWRDRQLSDRDFIQGSDEELWERDMMFSLIQLELFWGFFSPMEMRKYVMFCLLLYFRILFG